MPNKKIDPKDFDISDEAMKKIEIAENDFGAKILAKAESIAQSKSDDQIELEHITMAREEILKREIEAIEGMIKGLTSTDIAHSILARKVIPDLRMRLEEFKKQKNID